MTSEDKTLPTIHEVIVVEGRDDANAINRAVEAVTIETHGFGISKETWIKLERAYASHGLIVFTDPDHAGEEIRKRIKEKFPEAKEAFLSRPKATQGDDIGIENASPEDIREALSKAKATLKTKRPPVFSIKDLDDAGLTYGDGARERREALGDILGIGYANAKGLLKKLELMDISREDFLAAVEKLRAK